MIPLSFKEEVKRILKEVRGFRIFEFVGEVERDEESKGTEVEEYGKGVYKLWEVIYPEFNEEIFLTEEQVEYVLNILTSNSFLEKIGIRVSPQTWGGYKRWNKDPNHPDEQIKEINYCALKIRNYLIQNKKWYLAILERIEFADFEEILKENLMASLESLANFWIFNDINVFKNIVEEFRKKERIEVDKFKELKELMESKYQEIFKKELDRQFNFYGILESYGHLKIDNLLKKVHDLKNLKERETEKRNRNVLEFRTEEEFIYIEDLENFEIKNGVRFYSKNAIYERIVIYELTWRENSICDLNKIKNFCRNYKIPECFENLVKNFVFYNYLHRTDWYYIFANKKKRENFFRNFLIFLIKEGRFRNMIKKMLKVKETKEYKLFAEIGHYFWIKNWIRDLKGKINKESIELEDKKTKLKGYITEESFKILFEKSEREVKAEKRRLESLENDLKTTEEKIKKLLEELKITYNFENFEETLKNFRYKFGEENQDILISKDKTLFSEDKTRYENSIIESLWFFVDSIDKFLGEEILKSDFLSILESKQLDFWNQICSFLESYGFINKEKNIQKLKNNIRKSYEKFLKDTVLFSSSRKNSKVGLKDNNL